VASAFIFGDSLKTIFNCALFVFVTHPYDVGDRVIIGTTIPDTLFVHKINFYTTVFRCAVQFNAKMWPFSVEMNWQQHKY
jgi:small-conductance mechanosensitive channel